MRILKAEPKLLKHKGWYNAVFYDPETRRRKWVSLGTDAKDTAMRRFRDACAAFEKGDFNPWTDKYQPGGLTVEEAAAAFREAHAGEWMPLTRKGYRQFLGLMGESLPAGLLLRHLTDTDCRRVMKRPKKDGEAKAPGTERAYREKMSAFLNWCVEEGHLRASPLDKVKPPRVPAAAPAYLTRDEHARLVACVEAGAASVAGTARERDLVRLARVMRFGVATGLRLFEMQRLTWGDVDRAAGRIDVLGKGGKRRSVPLFPEAAAVLDAVLHDHVAAFDVKPQRRHPVFAGLPHGETSKEITHYLELVDLKEKVGRKAAHLLRHTFASWCAMAGVPLFTLKEWLGHSSIKTTEIYAHLAPDYVPEAALRLFGGAPETGPLRRVI